MMKTGIFARELKRTGSVSLFMLAHEVDVETQYLWMDQTSGNRSGLTNRQELVNLRADLARIEEGWVPLREDLLRYPRLEDWSIAEIEGEPLWRLQGRAHGWSGFATGLELVTTQVLAVDRCFTWARDRVHLFRLGDPDELPA